MYKGCCCYREIEHFKPKSKYKELCFDYSNLHYSCKRCTLAKGSQYNDDLLNPSEHDPEEYIRYIGESVVSIDNNKCGTEMIDVVKLNERADLKEERIRCLNEFRKNYELLISAIETILDSKDSRDMSIVKPFITNFIENVKTKSKYGESYCTMIKHNFSDKLDVLMEVLKEVNR